MTNVLLVRHGESQANAGESTPNHYAVELTAKGKAQAKLVAEYLPSASLVPDLIVCSPYKRAVDTASITMSTLADLNLPFTTDDTWHIQEFTYLSMWHHVVSTFTDRQEAVKAYWQNADPTYIDGPESESFEQFIDRVRDFKERLEATELNTIAIFSHEQFISAFLWLLEKDKVTPTSHEMREFRAYLLAHPIPNGAIVQAKFHKGYGWSLELITDHLNKVEERELDPLLSR